MEKISNYLEMIEDIQNKTPEKEAFCTGNSSLTYRELFLLVKEKQKKWKPADHKQLYFIRQERTLDQLTEFLACQGMGYVPVILPKEMAEDKKAALAQKFFVEISGRATGASSICLATKVPEEACMAVMTSGTSGENKLLFRTFESWYDYFPIQNEIFHITPESRLFMQGSLAFTGNMNLYMAQLSAGATILSEDRFDPRLWIKDIIQWQADGIYLIPTKLHALYQALKHEDHDPVETIRTILSGSQSLGKKEAMELKTFFPKAEITLYYGASELSYVTYIRDYEMNEDKTRIGRPFPAVDVCLKEGRLLVNTAFGVIGTEKEASAGDYAHQDAEGYFCFDGRKDDICNINGRKISVVRVEQAILNLKLAEQTAVKPIEKNGREYLAAWMILKEKNISISSREIRKMLKNTLFEEEIPRYIFFLDTFPVNESGKILKRALKAERQ